MPEPRPRRVGDLSRRRVGASRERAVRLAHDLLRASIRRGLFGISDPLVEFRLIRSLGVGRNTLRDALLSLTDEGLLVRRPGVGTLVARPMLHASAHEILALDDNGIDPLDRVTVRTLSIEPVEIGAVLAENLRIPTTRMTMIESLVSADGVPVCVLASCVPGTVDVQLYTREYASMASTFEHLTGKPLGSIDTTVEAIIADETIAGVLDVAVGSALVLREQVLMSADGTTAVVNFARYRGDRVAFTASTTFPQPSQDKERL